VEFLKTKRADVMTEAQSNARDAGFHGAVRSAGSGHPAGVNYPSCFDHHAAITHNIKIFSLSKVDGFCS
jgi:hypothetical protein